MRLSQAYVVELQDAAKVAHEKFSAAHARHADAATELGQASAVRSNLARRLDDARRDLRDAKQAALNSAITGGGFSEAAAKVAAIENEVALLDLSLKHFHAYDFSQQRCVTLDYKLQAFEKQHLAESLRLEHLTAKIQLEISAVAGRNGGTLEIQMNAATAGHRELCSRIRRDADGTREELKAATAEALALRNAWEKENKK